MENLGEGRIMNEGAPELSEREIHAAIFDIACARGEIYREHDTEYTFDFIAGRCIWDAATEAVEARYADLLTLATQIVGSGHGFTYSPNLEQCLRDALAQLRGK